MCGVHFVCVYLKALARRLPEVLMYKYMMGAPMRM
jgi:hypothetical protein